METKAIARYARCSWRKAQRVADLIRGKKAGTALLELRFMPYRAAKTMEKLLKSAMANAEHNVSAPDASELTISTIFVDQGPTMKRMRARTMGRGTIIRKRTAHITIHLTGAAQAAKGAPGAK